MSDPRKSYIASCVKSLLQIESFPKSFLSNQVLEEFLNSANVKAVQILQSPQNELIVCKVDEGSAELASSIGAIFISKIRNEEIDESNYKTNLLVSKMSTNPIMTLLNNLKNVYLPAFQDKELAQKLDPNVKRLLDELQAGLDRTVLKTQNQFASFAAEESEFMEVFTPNDEFDYWQNVEASASASSLKERAQFYNQKFAKLAKFYKDLSAVELQGLKEVEDETLDAIDQIWSFGKGNEVFREDRMRHLLDVFSTALGGRIQAEFEATDIWETPFANLKLKLGEAVRVLKLWSDTLVQNTSQIWQGKAARKWKSEPYSNQFIENLAARLSEINDIRSQHDELVRLYALKKSSAPDAQKLFSSLREINCMHVNSYSQPVWQAAVTEYSEKIQGVEQEIASFLKRDIFEATEGNPGQTMKEIQKWQGLLSRPSMMQMMQSERDRLLAGIFTQLDKIREEFEGKSGLVVGNISDKDTIPNAHNMSKVVNTITWVRNLSSRVKKFVTSGTAILSDLKKWQNFAKESQDLMNNMKEYEDEQFESWKTDILNALKNPEEKITLQMSGKLMELDLSDGLLKVNYSERLVLLLREVRQLSELGFRRQIPNIIHDTVEVGKKFYKEALTLKQVANFYNSMSSQIIESQKPMVVDLALNFEKVVKSTPKKATKNFDGSSEITWDNPVELQNYISKVYDAANAIMGENRKLRKVHLTICDQVSELFNIDLLKHRQLWKDHLEAIRRTIDQTVVNRDPKLCRPWRVHWDHQVYKALEFQYQKGLELLNQNLPEIKVEVIYSNKNISFKPSLEEIKQKFYKEVKSFISLPASGFAGVGGNAEIFKAMPEQNLHYLSVVYSKSEELFTKLVSFLDTLRPWAVIGALDPEKVIEQHFKTNEDWENNLKNLRLKRRDLEKVSESQKVDCFTVSLSPFKNSIEDLIQRFLEVITSSLKNSIKEDCDAIEEFITVAMEKLNRKPNSIDEITKAKAEIYEINNQKRDLQARFIRTEEKNKLLRNMVGNAQNISNVSKRWENFDVSLEGYNQMLGEQQQVIKGEIERKAQSLGGDIEKFYHRWTALKPKKLDQLDRESAKETAAKMKEWRGDWNALEEKIQTLEKDAEHFQLPRPQFNFLKEIRGDLVEQERSWALFDEFNSELEVMEKEDWLSFRNKVYTFQDFTFKWADRLKTLEKDVVSLYLLQEIENYKHIWPLLKLIIGEAFEKEHWKNLFSMLKMPNDLKVETVTFGNFLDAEEMMIKKELEIKELAARALGEIQLREAIQELRIWCDTTDFILTDYTANNRTTPLIKEWKDLMTKVSDNQALLGTLKDSKFYTRFLDQIEQFESKLGGIDEYLQKLNIIQRKWVYLEPIFGRGALPQEQPRFKRLDDEFRGIMLGIQRDPKVVSLCAIPGIKDTLEMILDQLERCQKALNDFLEEKRTKFPRFYFLGDDDLLEILGQCKNPNVIQMHLKKLFAGIHTVIFSKDISEILSMRSSSGEVVNLKESITVNEEIETWLGHLSKNMQATLQELLLGCLKESSLEIQKYPSQILCLSEEIRFHNNAIKAIQGGKLAALKSELQSKLEQYTSNSDANNVLSTLKLKALILDLIHQIEVVDALIADKVNDLQAWSWYRQLKFNLNVKARIAMIGMCKAEFDYTYEYQGNAQKLVHTPLTDKCYLTLTQGMFMGYGGNPYGPAGTGKTESVKALGQAFGRQVLVFNCDEGIDFRSMGRIFIGLVKCGAWGCFDEFNRLLEEQLSAISQQIQVIQFAIKERTGSVELLGKTTDVNKNAGIFVTLNPAGKGYGGRSKLPDNLKQLFRPVAMSVPDNELIAETLLFAEGFKTAKTLAKKTVSLFQLSRQLLSYQQHYDWGLRALKTILTVGGQLIQEERKKTKLDTNMEAVLLIKAIRINTMSKLTYTDAKKFAGLCADLFPGVQPEDIAYESLTKAIHDVLDEMKLDNIDSQIAKTLQFYEATKQRMGIVLVGPSGSGKTTIWKVLKKAQEKLGKEVKTHVMNPKSMPRQQLLGHMDNDTREFTDGVLTASARAVVKEPQEVLNWIICDGDIDPEWIESLNSVLDDNHLLTLPTGERISFGNNVNFIFETHDLQYASPATVSRMGMIFLNYEDVNIKSLIGKWIKRQAEDVQGKLEESIDEYFHNVFESVLHFEEQLAVKTTRVGVIMNVLSQMSQVKTKGEFIIAMVRGFAANFQTGPRITVCEEMYRILNQRPPVNPQNPLDYYYSKEANTFKPYTVDLTTELRDSDLSDPNDPPLVRTIGVQRDLDLIKAWVFNGDPFVVIGPEGCGKNLLIKSAFGELKKTQKIQITNISCNAQSSAAQIIQKLNQVCQKATFAHGRIFKPKDCNRLVLYLKDINLPKPDKYQTIQMIAFLQQIITHKGFYDEDLEFVHLDEKIQIVASMNPASTIGRYMLSTRFTANVRIAYVDYPTNDELNIIYTEYLKAVLSSPKFKFDKGNVLNLAKRIAPMLIEFYTTIKNKFLADDHRHYLLTPSHLTAAVSGLLRYNFDSAEQLGEVLCYELSRVFRDRLVDLESTAKFDGILNGLLRNHLKANIVLKDVYYSAIPNLREIKEGSKEIPNLTRLNGEDLKALISQGLMGYEREFTELKLHFLPEVLVFMSQLDRVLSKPGGAALVSGLSGIGRRICISLITHMLRLQLFVPQLTKDYSVREFKKDLRIALENAGVQGKPSLLFIEDHHLVKKDFLEMLNSLLSSGEVPGLYRPEEIEPMFGSGADEVRRENYGKSLYECFIIRIQRNLRLVFSFDHSHPHFGPNTASNPALFSRCNVIWFDNWTKESILAIVQAELSETLEKVQDKDAIQNQMISIHKSCSHRASPRHFFSLLETFKKIFTGKLFSRGESTQHLKAGLKKLVEAQDFVDKLTTEAQEKKILLAKQQAEADQALKEITKAMQKVAERKQETETLQVGLQEEEAVISSHKIKIENEMRDIQPLVDEAKKAVGSISKSNLDELRMLRMPPEPIHDVFSAILLMNGIRDNSWTSMKKFLSQRTVLESILDFDVGSITPDMRKEILKYIAEKKNSFEKAVIYRASLAAGPIADWVKAILQYSEVFEKIRPLNDEMRKLIKKQEISTQRLQECQAQLYELDKQVTALRDDFSTKTAKAESLKFELKKAEETLGLAQNLLGKLGEEKDRWQSQVAQIDAQIKSLPFDCLLAAAFTVYLSDADEVLRENTLKEWKVITKNNNFGFLKFLGTESLTLQWKSEGLPSDGLSLENTLMIFNSSKIPLLIDPNTQATEWLKRHFAAEKNVEVLNQSDPKFQTLFELAVRFGKTLIVMEVDQVDPYLFPVLRREILRQGPRSSVQIGEKLIDYNESFRMYMCTRNPVLEIPPNASALISVINYTVTRSGLEAQLLSIIINHEKPELEQKKTELLQNEENLKMKLNELEKKLLEELASSSGNILENKTLIDSLNQTKASSMTIANSLRESSELQASLDKQREVYRPLANKGSRLFLLINDLEKINRMYRFSLNLFIKLFKKCLHTQVPTNDINEKLESNIGSLFRLIFQNIGASLFKSDRLMFGLHLVNGMRSDLFQPNEWEFFLGNAVGSMEVRAQVPRWCSNDRKEIFLSYASVFSKIAAALQFENEATWQPWFANNECERNHTNVAKKLSPFHRAILVQVFRPDRLESALSLFICEALSISSISISSYSFKNLFREESAPETPILFLTSPGSDPSKELEEFAEAEVGRDNFQQLSMGGNQNEVALTMLRDAIQKGYWVCFKNLHLVVSWLTTLEKELKMHTPHPKFRLWLTSEAHPKFPAILLETCYKVTYEAPPGIKKNLTRTYQSWNPSFIEQGSVLRAQMYFVLAWFHAVIQERRTYIPQGWSKFYEFSYGDLKAGGQVIELLLESNDKDINWNTLYGLFENAIYGGRIDNDHDMRVIKAYLQAYFNPEIFTQGKKLAGIISVPTSNSIKEYLALINKLSDTDNPTIFGLPLNIDRSVQRFNTTLVIEGIKKLMVGSAEDLRFDREKWSEMLGPIIKLWKSLYTQVTDKGIPQIREKQLASDDPLESFVYSEAYNCYNMLEKINRSIEGLSQVLFGSGILTSEIQEEAIEILKGQIPAKWLKIWDGPNNPNSWLKGFCKRAFSLKSWIEMLKNDLLGFELNLSDLFHPEILLNAFRQRIARKINYPIDSLRLVAVFNQGKIKAPLIMKVKGLLLQGCNFDGGKLTEPDPNMSEFMLLPTIYLAWIEEANADLYPDNMKANIPVYLSGAREKMLCKLDLPNSGTQNDRIIQGVALLLSEEE